MDWTPIRFGGTERNMTDAAIARCAFGSALSWIDGIGPIKGIASSIQPGARVRKARASASDGRASIAISSPLARR